jgi:hypothetical protein
VRAQWEELQMDQLATLAAHKQIDEPFQFSVRLAPPQA